MQGKRYALPNTRIMLHHPSGSARGQASDIHNEARELMRLRNYVNKVLCQATSKPIEKVALQHARFCHADNLWHMSALACMMSKALWVGCLR